MSKDFTTKELIWVCEQMGVKYDKYKGKDLMIKSLEEEGITKDMIRDSLSRKESGEEIKEVFTKKDPVTLIKMTRRNPTFRFRGYKFTKEHPFVLMSDEDAIAIMMLESGFSKASVKEAEEYYGSS